MAEESLPRICEIDGCNNHRRTRGMCNGHYARWYKYGDPLHVPEHTERKCSIDGCDEKHHANGYCQPHNDQNRRNGSPFKRYRSVRGEKIRWLERHKGHQGDECLTFPFPLGRDGYGLVQIDGVSHRAAHAMLRLAEGPPPTEGHECAHNCGRGSEGCVNPAHLRWATSAENTDDQRVHGTLVRGDRHGMARLTEGEVRKMRELVGEMTSTQLANRFGVSYSQVRGILSGREWAWLK